jgi:hypothetical protein
VRGQHRELKPIQELRFLFVWFETYFSLRADGKSVVVQTKALEA